MCTIVAERQQKKNHLSLRPQRADTEPPRSLFNSLVKHWQLDWCALSNTPKKGSAAKKMEHGEQFLNEHSNDDFI